jgi:hypothetical protein
VGHCAADGRLRDAGAGKGDHLAWRDVDPPAGYLPNNCAGSARRRHLRVAEYAALFRPTLGYSRS